MKSTHSLAFEVAEDPISELLGNNFLKFRVGTCGGLYRATDKSYDILAISNESPGNGHLNDVFEWFENSCKRDRKKLRVLEVWNENFKTHLLTKRGFKLESKDNLVKKIK